MAHSYRTSFDESIAPLNEPTVFSAFI